MTIELGQPIPDFSAETDQGPIRLADLAGKAVVLYFYPKDDTSGCTSEAKAFRDKIADFTAKDAVILGVSKDSVASHQKFRAKHDLPFALISDTDGALCEAFGTWVEKSMYGRKYMGIERATFLIDASGRLAAQWRKVKVTGHADQVLKALP